MPFRGMKAEPPSRQQLQQWERVCRYIDAQPYRSVAIPLPMDPPMSVRLLKRMAYFKLIHHREDCTWRLTKDWQPILDRLRLRLPEEEPEPKPKGEQPPPFVADVGIDTWYINLLAEDLPLGLLNACEALKAEAQAADDTVATPWRVWDAPLSMWKAGKGSSGKKRGASWGYILRNEYVEIRLRKTAVSDIIGRVHFLARGLWTYGPRADLDAVSMLIRDMWYWDYVPPEADSDEEPLQMPGCCTSEIHLCADVVHFDMQPVDLERIVTRSIRQAVHVPVVGDDGYQEEIDPEDLLDLDAFDEIDPLPVDLSDLDAWDDEPDEEEEEDEEENQEPDDEPEEEDLAQDDGSIVHLWAKRVSGFMFSPGGDLMVEFYDKALQERGWDMEWMKRIHRSGGWDGKARLTRVEARFRRPTLRELRAAFGDRDQNWIDDPWKLLDHLQDLWAYAFGMPPEADIPDVAYKGWMRLAVQTEDENRGRWPTDPIWHIVQRAKFTERAPIPLERHKQQKPDLNRLDAGLYGYLITRIILTGGQMDPTITFDQAVAAFIADMHERDDNPAATFKPSHFAADVRERARMRGKPLPLLPPRASA